MPNLLLLLVAQAVEVIEQMARAIYLSLIKDVLFQAVKWLMKIEVGLIAV